MDSKSKINSLISVRFFWQLSIMLGHFVIVYKEFYEQNDFFDKFRYGNYAVICFFISSGFFIARKYEKIGIKENGIQFAINNNKRNYVAYVVSFLPWFVFCLFDVVKMRNTKVLFQLILRLIANLLMVNGWIPVQGFLEPFNNITWFMSALTACYIFAPFLLRVVVRVNRKYLYIHMVILLIIIYVVDKYWASSGAILYGFWGYRIVEFVLGMYLWILVRDLEIDIKRWQIDLIVIMNVAVYLFLHNGLASSVVGILLIGALYMYKGETYLNNSRLIMLGSVSNLFYLFHNPIFSFGKHFLSKLISPENNLGLFLNFVFIMLTTFIVVFVWDKVSSIIKERKKCKSQS